VSRPEYLPITQEDAGESLFTARSMGLTTRATPGKHKASPCVAVALCLVVAGLLAMGAAPAAGNRVVIVMSGEDAPYVAASDEARTLLVQQGHQVSQMTLDKYTASAGGSRPTADIWLAVGTKAAVALSHDVRPPARLVYSMVSGLDAAGLTEGNTVCGVGTDIPLDAQLKLIAEALPGAKTVGVLYRSDVPGSAAMLKAMEAAVPPQLKVVSVAVDKHESVAAAIEALLDQKVSVVWTAPDAAVYNVATVRAVLLSAVRRQIPVFGFSPACVKAGAVLGVGIDPKRQGAQAAGIVSRLASGLPAAQLPAVLTETPVFQIAVNLTVADRLAIALPAELINRADIVFKPEGTN
jgi:putative tryptophan/tyrosine transport system substrate-binding protein